MAVVAGGHVTGPGRFAEALNQIVVPLESRVEMDWSCLAGTLEWSCWQTVDHLIDCLFSYALQLSSRASGSFLPFHELHALPEAGNSGLVTALRGVGDLLRAALVTAPDGPCAGDGLVQMDAEGWAQRGAYELLVHGYDILSGLGQSFAPPEGLCPWVLA